MRAALAELGFPAWQADGLLEESAMYRRGEAAGLNRACEKSSAQSLVRSRNSRVTMPRCAPDDRMKHDMSRGEYMAGRKV